MIRTETQRHSVSDRSQIGDNSGSPVTAATEAAGQMRSYFERWQRLEEERKTLADDIAAVYQEMTDAGLDKHAAKIIIKIRKNDGGLVDWTGRSATVDAYLVDLGMLPGDEDRAPAPAHARVENVHEFPLNRRPARAVGEAFDPVTGEIQESAADLHRRGSTSTENVSDEISATIPEAKASEDNGTTAKDRTEVGTGATGEASRLSDGSGPVAPIPPVGAADDHSVIAEAGAAEATAAPAEIQPAPHGPTADDGQPSTPSPEADGAKMDGRLSASPERAADEAGHISVQSGQAVEDFQPPAFLLKPKKPSDYRPHCLHPEACGSSQLKHCHQCAKAAGLEEAA